jgi:hypothetical protein
MFDRREVATLRPHEDEAGGLAGWRLDDRIDRELPVWTIGRGNASCHDEMQVRRQRRCAIDDSNKRNLGAECVARG